MADDLRPPRDLYEEDFFVWTQVQAEALRAARPAGVDWARLAEEIEDMGKRDLRGAESLLARIIEHLYLIELSARREPVPHWRAEIAAFQGDLQAELTPSIRRKLEQGLERLHRRAAEVAAKKLAAYGETPPAGQFSRRWELPVLLGELGNPFGAA